MTGDKSKVNLIMFFFLVHFILISVGFFTCLFSFITLAVICKRMRQPKTPEGENNTGLNILRLMLNNGSTLLHQLYNT